MNWDSFWIGFVLSGVIWSFIFFRIGYYDGEVQTIRKQLEAWNHDFDEPEPED